MRQAGELGTKLDTDAAGGGAAASIRGADGNVDVVAFMDWYAAHMLAPAQAQPPRKRAVSACAARRA
jgi:hypothetical protein